jgi:ABC-2 type transport system permease protein
MALWPGVHVTPVQPLAILWFALFGSTFLALLGVLTSIWAEKFDHAAVVTSFVVGPLALLSGTFYSVDRLSPAFQTVSHLNPFFYIISGFRFGFLGVSDGHVSIWASGAIILAIDVVLAIGVYALLKSGWKLKN